MLLTRQTFAIALCAVFAIAVLLATTGLFIFKNGMVQYFNAATIFSMLVLLQFIQVLYWKIFEKTPLDTHQSDLMVVINWLIVLSATVYVVFSPIQLLWQLSKAHAWVNLPPAFYISSTMHYLTALFALQFWKKTTRQNFGQTAKCIALLALLLIFGNFGNIWALLGL